MYSKVFVPYKGYWSSPFSRWQMSFQNISAIELGAATARKFLELRDYDINMFDGCVLGMTVGQYKWFHATPWFCALMGNDKISGPMISQACATSATCLFTAASYIEAGMHQNLLLATTDRCSNSSHAVWPNPNGPGG